MSARNWHKVDEETHVAFSCPCQEKGSGRGGRTWDLKCTGIGFEHGHVSVSTADDGDCWIPFPCGSQAGLRKLLEHESKSWLSAEEFDAIMALDEVQRLPAELTPGEAEIFNDPVKLKDFTTAFFHSF